MSPGEQVYAASGLSRRRFAAITGASMRGGRLDSARIDTCAGWIRALAEHGIRLELEVRATPAGISTVCREVA